MCFFVASGELGVQPLAGAKPADEKLTEAQQAMDLADTLRSKWTKASLQESIALYEKAALIWTSALDFPNASQAALKSGDVYSLLSEYDEARKRYQNAAALAEKTSDWLMKASALSRMGRLNSLVGKNELAQRELSKALDLFKQHGASRNEASANAYGEALTNLAEVSYSRGDFVKAQEQLKTTLELFRNNPKGAARAHLFTGFIIGSIGNPERAVKEVQRALELYREADDKVGEGLALTTLGLSHSIKRDVKRATELQGAAIEIFRAVGDRHSEATARNAMGQAYASVGQDALATHEYEQALRLFEEIGFVDGMAISMFKLADLHNRNGQPDQALKFYERALELSRAAQAVRMEAIALNEIAKFYVSRDRRKLALLYFQKIQKFFEGIGDLQGQATALNAQGEFLLNLGQNEEALQLWRQALPLSEKVGDKGVLISLLYNLGRANLAVGSPEAALPLVRRSLEIIEDLRGNVASPEFRLSYFSGGRRHYELCIEVLMQLERLRPGEGFAAEALLVSERGRARLLQDLVSESQINLREGAAPPLLERERELRGLLRAQARYRMDLTLRGKDPAEVAAVDEQLTRLRAEYQEIQAQLRQQNPRLFSSHQPAPLSLQQIQDELRNDDSMLLEYFLGEERSYLWAVTSNSVQSYALSPRKSIEDAARELYRLTTARHGSDGQTDQDYQAGVEAADNAYLESATKLSHMLLGPVAEQLGTRRLLVVTEGALQHTALEALPVPVSKGDGQTLLLENNEVVVLPSFSTLLAIRSAPNRTSSPGKLIAVIADPVFSPADERVQGEGVSPGIALAGTDKNTDYSQPATRYGLTRLAHASEEADAISAVAPWGTTMVVKGFDADREAVMGSDVGQYQIVHFATHGYLDNEHPELSGIVLTMVDRNGVWKNGLMPLHDIYSLDLSAELTVLSACQTALGKDIKGEGLVGLTHSFMSAGSKSVVASLWKVDDRATAALMAEFHESTLRKGMPSAAALRSAKLKVMRDRRWSAPYYWAGFVFQGDYTNRITVDHHSWRRPGLVLLFLLILIAAGLLFFQRRKRRSFPTQHI